MDISPSRRRRKKILIAIRRILGGEPYVSEKMAARITSKLIGQKQHKLPMDRLTDRELSVLEMTGRGLATRQIAESLNLDISTVETYRTRIRQKLDFKDPSELLPFAIQWVHTGTPRD